jgi:hypothetical protein
LSPVPHLFHLKRDKKMPFFETKDCIFFPVLSNIPAQVYSTGVGAKTDQSELCEPGGDYH